MISRNAWNSLGSMSSETAKGQYVKHLKEFIEDVQHRYSIADLLNASDAHTRKILKQKLVILGYSELLVTFLK